MVIAGTVRDLWRYPVKSLRGERCVMVNLAQDELPADARILRAVAHVNAARLGVYAEVLRPGAIHAGDHIVLL